MLSTRGDRVDFVLDAEIGTGVRQLARAARATPFAVLAAAVAALVAHASGQDDVVIGTPVSRRDDEDLTPMIACLSDVMPLRQRVSPQDSFADLVARAKAEVWGAVAHRDAPYSQADPRSERGALARPFPLVPGGLRPGRRPCPGPGSAGGRSRADVRARGHGQVRRLPAPDPRGGGFRGYAEFSTDLFDRSTVERLAQRLAVLLRAAAAEPRRSLAELDLLPPSEHALLDAWAHGAAPASDAPLAHEAVAAQALRTPDALAVVHGERSLTYAQAGRGGDRRGRPARGRRGRRAARRRMPAPLPGARRRRPGRPQGRELLSAPRPRLPGRPHRSHGRRQRHPDGTGPA